MRLEVDDDVSLTRSGTVAEEEKIRERDAQQRVGGDAGRRIEVQVDDGLEREASEEDVWGGEEGSGRQSLVLVWLGVLLFGAMVGVGVFTFLNRGLEGPAEGLPSKRDSFLQSGWRERGHELIAGFLNAKTAEEKARYVIGGESEVERIREAMESGELDLPLLSTRMFAAVPVPRQMAAEGVFAMVYQQPKEIRLDHTLKPIFDLEVSYRTREPTFHEQASQALQNRKRSVNERRAIVFFSGLDEESLRLDWEVLVQTWHEKVLNLRRHGAVPDGRTFRVLMRAMHPVDLKQHRDGGSEVWVFLADPAYEFYRVAVKISDSGIAKKVGEKDWGNLSNSESNVYPATVRLAQDEEGDLVLVELLSWGFLGLESAEPLE